MIAQKINLSPFIHVPFYFLAFYWGKTRLDYFTTQITCNLESSKELTLGYPFICLWFDFGLFMQMIKLAQNCNNSEEI
jgi:hypothetical protein